MPFNETQLEASPERGVGRDLSAEIAGCPPEPPAQHLSNAVQKRMTSGCTQMHCVQASECNKFRSGPSTFR